MLELPFDLVSFDAYNYFPPSLLVYTEELSAFGSRRRTGLGDRSDLRMY